MFLSATQKRPKRYSAPLSLMFQVNKNARLSKKRFLTRLPKKDVAILVAFEMVLLTICSTNSSFVLANRARFGGGPDDMVGSGEGSTRKALFSQELNVSHVLHYFQLETFQLETCVARLSAGNTSWNSCILKFR